MRMLGDMYFDGDGGERDYTLARSWYEKAAAGGVTAAMISLGDMYRDGKGVHSDPQQALQWYQRAAAIKDKNTNEAIKRINKL
jgi:TPR repeat protein